MTNQRFKEEGIILLALATASVLLVLRYHGMYPSIMPDEYMHSKFARLVPYSEIEIPGYAYYFIFSITQFCGDGFIECSRILNVLFYAVGGYFVFKVSRMYLSFSLSATVSILSLAMPMNTYVSYFMPEAMYFGIFWILQYSIFAMGTKVTQKWIICGILLGLLALVKPHAHFLLPVYVLLISFEQGISRNAMKDIVLLTTGFVLLRYGLGSLFAGIHSLSVFGVQYSEHASSALSDLATIAAATKSLMLNTLGNVVVLALLFGLPIVLMMHGAFTTKTQNEYRLYILPLLILLVMVPVVALFATSTALFDANVDNRIHLRYYSFMFPFFFIIAFKHFNAALVQMRSTITLIAIILVAILGFMLPYLHSLNQFLYPYAIIVTDIPEIFLLIQYNYLLYLVVLLSVVSLIVWIRKPSTASRLYMFGFLPLFLAITWFTNFKVNDSRYKEQSSDIAGNYIRKNLSPVSQDSLLVIGYMKNNNERALMYSDSKLATSMTLSLMDPFLISHAPQGTRYILTLDSLDLTLVADVIWKEHFSYLYRVRPANSE
jgi:phosphoglycerol transferase